VSEALQTTPEAPVDHAAPIDELSALVTWGAALFFWAEEGVNDSIKSYWDALHYIATSLSVGYANIFPVTPLGKTIGAIVMMVGPALSARALEPAHPESSDASAGAVVAKLDAILDELKKLNGAR
jgi:voltage-gated potassium channel